MESILLEDNPHWNNLNAYDNINKMQVRDCSEFCVSN